MSAAPDGRSVGLREVLLVAFAVLAAVFLVEAVVLAIPALRDAFRGVPVTVLVLVVGTGVVLLGVFRHRPPAPPR